MTASEHITRIKGCSVMHVIAGVLHRVPAAQAQHLPPVLRHEDGHHAGPMTGVNFEIYFEIKLHFQTVPPFLNIFVIIQIKLIDI